MVRYLPKGGLDKDFGGGDGIVLTDFGKRYQGANAVVVYPNGNIAAGRVRLERLDRAVGRSRATARAACSTRPGARTGA